MYGDRRKEEEIDETQCSTSGSQSSNENESCLMAIEELKVTSNSCDSTPYTFDELQDAFEELAIDFESMNLKYKKMISKLNVENELLSKTKIDLEKIIDGMKIEFDKLRLNFETSQKRIAILENENLILKEKCEGLMNRNNEPSKTISCTKMTKCTHCNYHGHSLNTFPIRRKIPYKFRQVWLPKGTRDFETNSQGPKAIWVQN